LELREAIFNRHSIRAYKSKEVKEAKLIRILEDANQAPSAGNLQARDFIIVKDKQRKNEIARAALNQDFIAQSPVILVICANRSRSAMKYGKRGAVLYSILDAALAAQNLILSCEEEGLGSCYVGAFDEEMIRRILRIPEDIFPVGIIPVGFPDEEPFISERIPIERLVHRERW
jgi:nitroreductase